MREFDQSSQAVKFKGLLIHTSLQAAALPVTRQERVNPSPASTKLFPLGPSAGFAAHASQDLSGTMIALSGASKVNSEEPFSTISQGAAIQAVLETASFFPTCRHNSHCWCIFYNPSSKGFKKKKIQPHFQYFPCNQLFFLLPHMCAIFKWFYILIILGVRHTKSFLQQFQTLINLLKTFKQNCERGN